MGYFQLCSDHTTTISISTFVHYTIHAGLLNKTLGKLEWLINNGYTIIGLLLYSISYFNVEEDKTFDNAVDQNAVQHLHLKNEVLLTSTFEGREKNMIDLHNALKRTFLSRFLTHSYHSAAWNFFWAVESYCTDIRLVKTLSTANHGCFPSNYSIASKLLQRSPRKRRCVI